MGAAAGGSAPKGIPVSLSIGGFGTGYSLPSRQAALDLSSTSGTPTSAGASPACPAPSATPQHPVRAREADLTATPRCTFPPVAYLKRAVDTGIFERVHVRIYDDDNCEAYWHLAWDRWTAAYPVTRFYVGMTASKMTHGWVHPKNVYYDVMPSVQKADNYSGFMI
ncbi:Xylanase inhibitor protein 1 [Dichanthelium oligosanthes]|uniref:Xylanase inhibitor protein 1 n=1 Tax=Dichanthelium oligosanthes TaxID=888268 RepID=A0A1E5VZH8_9POAL|nr:Xylanase inhibitor protein 1 [Dichanthelium oligosanthes]